MGRVGSEVKQIGVDVQFPTPFSFFQSLWSENRETFGNLRPAATPGSAFRQVRVQRKKYCGIWTTSPAMSTFQYPPSPLMIFQQTCSISWAGTILDHVPSNPLTVSLRAGSAVFFRSKHPRIAYRADAMGVKTAESRAGDGSVLIRIVWRVEIWPVTLGRSDSVTTPGGDAAVPRNGW